jgi:hypothetical protein
MEGIAPLGTLDPQHVIAQLAKALADPARTFASPSPSWDASGSQRAKAGRGASTQYFQADGVSYFQERTFPNASGNCSRARQRCLESCSDVWNDHFLHLTDSAGCLEWFCG